MNDLIQGFDDGFDDEVFCRELRGKFPSFSESRAKDAPYVDAQRLGIVKTLPRPGGANKPLLVVAAKLPDGMTLSERSSRVKQFTFAKKTIDVALTHPAPGLEGILTQGLFVFYDDDGNFRLSLVYGKAEGTKLVWSSAKRSSFYVEAGAANKTFRDRSALDWSTFDKLKDAFSVEKLTKEFYSRLFAWYQNAMDADDLVFPNDIVKDKEPGEVKSEQIIRLITRLMFVWFLKQKGLVPDKLFSPGELKTILKEFKPLSGENYYRAILQNLFFATLNSEIKEREFAVDAGNIKENSEHFGVKVLYRYGAEFAISQKDVLQLFRGIPFLNGGLFECLDREKAYFDGFSRKKSKQARVPNRLFFDGVEGLIPLLQQYNFTVEENSPGDEEVALDPELLGKVFENLLGAYNPETQVAARNATGSFYTPREIVNYMVDESLKAHVKQKVAQTFLSANPNQQAKMPSTPFVEPITISRRRLPHWHKDHAVYWVTFRLADSIPQEKLRVWKAERDEWKSLHSEPWTEDVWAEYDKRFTAKMEAWLDAGMGSRALAREDVREAVRECLLRFDGERVHVHAAVIMPTHIHCLLEPLPKQGVAGIPACESLSVILKGMKGASARAVNKLLGQTGTFWMDESYDHIVRNEKQYRHFVRYIEENPGKAGLREDEYWLMKREGQAGMPATPSQTGMSASPFEEAIDLLFAEGVRPGEAALCREIDDALTTARILDPACGSGAFPMGILLRMVDVLRVLRGTPADDHDAIYAMKLRLIENCIYGGDIQCIAVQITKLRFFISLVCEEKVGQAFLPAHEEVEESQTRMSASPLNNYGIHTLPNLETKFVAADSLIGLPRSGDMLPMQNVEALKKELWDVRHRHFLARSYQEKKALRKEDKRLREALAKALEEGGGFDTESAHLMAAWDPYDQNASAPFSDSEWMFNVKDGFDVVIGNPPYIQLQSNGGALTKKYARCNFKCFDKLGDIYCLFYERGCELLTKSGHLCYITSKTWMRNSFGKPLREYLLNHTKPLLLADYQGVQVFDSVTVNTNIILLARGTSKEKQTFFRTCVIRDDAKGQQLADYISKHSAIQAFDSSESWVLLSGGEQDIKAKIALIGKPLKEWGVSINYGIKTGLNEAFIVDQETRDRLVAEDPDCAQILRPILRGRDIKRYSAFWSGKYLIATHNGYGRVKAVDVSTYPSVKKWLKQYEPKLSKRCDQGDTAFNLRDCAYYPDFMLGKIVWGEISDRTKFSYDDGTYCVEATAFFLTSEHAKLLLAVLNSTVAEYLFSHIGTKTGMGTIRWKKYTIEQLPIPVPTGQQREHIESLANHILAAKKTDPAADTSALEAEIDQLVYQLYGLTEEEIAIVEGVKKGGAGIPACPESQTGMSASPSKKKPRRRKTAALPPSLEGWD